MGEIDEEDASRLMTPEKIHTYEMAFKLFDKDASNAIDGSELHKAMHSLGKRMTLEQAEDMIAEFDEDDSGQIDMEEFLKMMARADAVQGTLDGIGEVFQVFDADGDGAVTHEEFTSVLVSYQEDISEMLTIEQITKLINLIDVDGDGEIDHSEFTSFLIAQMT